APMWKEVLDFDLFRSEGKPEVATAQRPPRAREKRSLPKRPESSVKDLVAGTVFKRPTGGMVAVVNVGMDENWLAHPFAMANLFAFGRLAWNPNLDARAIFEEWSRLTFGNDAAVVKTTTDMAMASWKAYENYTGPLGAQTLTDIVGSHYG